MKETKLNQITENSRYFIPTGKNGRKDEIPAFHWIGPLHNRNWMNPLLKVANFEDSDIFNGE